MKDEWKNRMDSVKDEPHSDSETWQDGNQVIIGKAEDVSDIDIEEHPIPVTSPVTQVEQEVMNGVNNLQTFVDPDNYSTDGIRALFVFAVHSGSTLPSEQSPQNEHELKHGGRHPNSCDVCSKTSLAKWSKETSTHT